MPQLSQLPPPPPTPQLRQRPRPTQNSLPTRSYAEAATCTTTAPLSGTASSTRTKGKDKGKQKATPTPARKQASTTGSATSAPRPPRTYHTTRTNTIARHTTTQSNRYRQHSAAGATHLTTRQADTTPPPAPRPSQERTIVLHGASRSTNQVKCVGGWKRTTRTSPS